MALTVRSNPDRPSGGHAVLEGEGLEGVATLTIENTYSGLFLGSDGRWNKQPYAFPVAHGATGVLFLGPDIVDAIATDLLLVMRTGEGRDLGRLFWADVAPSRSRRSPASLVTPPQPSLLPSPPVAREEPAPPLPSDAPVVATPSAAPAALPFRWKGVRLTVAVAVLAAIGVGAGLTIAMRSRSVGPAPEGGACAAFAELSPGGESGDDRHVRRAEQALAAGCGGAAFARLEDADWRRSESAAWYLARFYDPNEGDPAYRLSARAHPAWAAAYYRHWAASSPRHAAALATLCHVAPRGAAQGADEKTAEAGLARACAP